MPRDWDAVAYDRLPIPTTRWGGAVVDRLELRGDETVLDAGCGTGQVTELLLRRLPRGRVVAVDGSPAMAARARERLRDDRVSVLVADLLDPMPLARRVDAVLSTATFHWIADHRRLFSNLAAALRPGGQLEAQCGGAGNIATVIGAVRTLGIDAGVGKRYATAEETSEILRASGFVDVRCWLEQRPTPLPQDDLEDYLRAICLGGVLERMAESERDTFVRNVASAMPEPTIDYVRLNISARRR